MRIKASFPRAQNFTAAEPVDLTLVDTPAEAAQMPLLEPAFQLALATGMAASRADSNLNVTVLMSQTVNSFRISTSYELDANNKEYPIKMSGTVNGSPFLGELVRSPHLPGPYGSAWNSRFGDNRENLLVDFDPGRGILAVRGHIGTVGTDINTQWVLNGEQDGIVTDGVLGDGRHYHIESTISHTVNNEGERTMSTEGHLGEQTVEKTYTVKNSRTDDGSLMTIAGGGENLGQHQSISVALLLGGGGRECVLNQK